MAKITYYDLMDDDELIQSAREARPGTLAHVLGQRLEQAFDPETGMTAAELSAAKKEADDLERDLENAKSDIERLEAELASAEAARDDAEAALEQLREQEDVTT